jgi:hypothetical protein
MKTKADAIADLGEPVSDRTLVLNILRGLNERFQFMAQLITRQKSFPSFSDVRADLRLAELNMEKHMAPPSVLLATPTSKPSAPPLPTPPRPLRDLPLLGVPLLAADVGAVTAVGVAKAALKVAKAALEARHGPPCSIHGLVPFICGPPPT